MPALCQNTELDSRVLQAFDGFVAELARSAALAAAPTPATKVKAVADAVWSRLNKGSYSKDLQHAQVGGLGTGHGGRGGGG